jgi:hypothetical protein
MSVHFISPHFTNTWRDADPGLPQLAQVKAEFAARK